MMVNCDFLQRPIQQSLIVKTRRKNVRIILFFNRKQSHVLKSQDFFYKEIKVIDYRVFDPLKPNRKAYLRRQVRAENNCQEIN